MLIYSKESSPQLASPVLTCRNSLTGIWEHKNEQADDPQKHQNEVCNLCNHESNEWTFNMLALFWIFGWKFSILKVNQKNQQNYPITSLIACVHIQIPESVFFEEGAVLIIKGKWCEKSCGVSLKPCHPETLTLALIWGILQIYIEYVQVPISCIVLRFGVPNSAFDVS